jgi:CD151 antigen
MQTKLLDDLQTKLKCCGATNFLDWRESRFIINQNRSDSLNNLLSAKTRQYNQVAESCCKTPSYLCGKRTHPSNINYQGCVQPLVNYISQHLILLGVVALSSCLLEIIGIIISSLLIRRLKQRKQYDELSQYDN